eukprot:scaffold32099_cov50-Attheya_sp.AAC.2
MVRQDVAALRRQAQAGRPTMRMENVGISYELQVIGRSVHTVNNMMTKYPAAMMGLPLFGYNGLTRHQPLAILKYSDAGIMVGEPDRLTRPRGTVRSRTGKALPNIWKCRKRIRYGSDDIL